MKRFVVGLFAHRLLLLLVAAAAVAVSFHFDRPVAERLAQPIESGQTKAILSALRCWGEGTTLVVIAAAMVLLRPHRWFEPLAMLIVTLVCAGAVDLIKPVVGRPRPNLAVVPSVAKLEAEAALVARDERRQTTVYAMEGQLYVAKRRAERDSVVLGAGEATRLWNSSFPSGHSATAFAFAAGLAYYHPALRLLGIAAASGTALSRMYDRRHYLSDCVAGGLLGWFLAGGLLRSLDAAAARWRQRSRHPAPASFPADVTKRTASRHTLVGHAS